MEQNEFVVVTDGLFGEFDMSFGWKICTLNGQNLAEHAGPAFGQHHHFEPKAMVFYQHLVFSVVQWSIRHRQSH
eukprot:995981-Ditylum_brightwellii.AAC.1